jgi:hypothetical protein
MIKAILKKENIIRCLLISVVPACVFYFVSIAIMTSNGFEVMQILRDPAQQSGQNSFLGFLSNIGVWLWVSSTAICFFAFLNNNSSFKNKELLFLVGTLSLMLAVDDFFMIHDNYIDQGICYLAYAILGIALLVRQYKKIISIDGFAFILAGSLLAMSIITDLVQKHIPLTYETVQIIEECFKFTGGAIWFYFCFRMGSNSLK